MEKKLLRNEQDKMLAGVCSGLADYFDVDVTWIRIAFVVATLAGFSGVLAYIILWIAVPARPFIPGAPYQGSSRYTADYRVKPEPAGYTSTTQTVTGEPVLPPRKSGNGRMIAGLLLVAFGAYFLLDEFNVIPYWFDFDKLWPLIFIIPGLLIISKNGKRRHYHEEEKIHTEPTTAAGDSSTTTDTGGTTTVTTTTSETVTKQEDPKL
jgi:phage shock protein PspC (stress-responsive transcriptional regulator)